MYRLFSFLSSQKSFQIFVDNKSENSFGNFRKNADFLQQQKIKQK
jgi:hypothetical protein